MDFRKTYTSSGILCLFLIAATFMLAYFFLKPGHIMGGDFALYVRQILCIWQGDGGQVQQDMAFMLDNSSNDLYSPILYPWGYPVLLAPFYPVFGLNLFAYKILTALFFAGSIGLIFITFRQKKDFTIPAFLIAVLIAVQPKYLLWLNMVLSEMPYLFFVILSIYAINKLYTDREITPSHIPAYAGLGVLMMFTAQIRTEGFLLFPALAMWHLYYICQHHSEWLSWKKAPRYLLIVSTPYLSALIFYLLFIQFFPAGFMKHTDHFEYTSGLRVLANVLGYFRSIQQFSPLGSTWLTMFFLSISFWGMIWRFPKDLLETSFILFSVLLLLIWPHQNSRHLFALLPFFVYFFAQGLASIRLHIFKIPWPAFILLAGLLFVAPGTIRSARQNCQTEVQPQSYGTDSPAAKEMFDYVRNNIPPKDIVAHSQPRTIYLYTNHKCIAIWGMTDMLWSPANWYIWNIHGGRFLQYSKEEIEEYADELTEIFRNNDYVIYKIKKNER